MYKLNILISYSYFNSKVTQFFLNNQDQTRFVLDSGAFTAWKAGKPIQLDTYCKFLESLPVKPWRYFALDVIGNPEATMKNYQIMLSRGFNPIPVFTRGDDLSVIDEYYKTSDVLGLGGLVGTQNNKGYVKSLMSIIGDRKTHWLGFTNINFIRHYKPYMCDSSSVSSGIRFGKSQMFFEPNIWKIFYKQDNIHKYSHLIKEYGFDPLDFKNKTTWKNSSKGLNSLEVINYRSYVRYQYYIYKNYKTLYFLAVMPYQINLIFDAYKYWIMRGLIK